MDANSAEAQVHLIQSIDYDIEVLEQSILALKHRRNAVVPISRLPPEGLAIVFSFLSPPECDEEVYYQTLIRATHVCRYWRETALNYPTLWSHIDLFKLRQAGIAEILVRARMVPLHLEVSTPYLSKAQFDIFKRQLDVHIPHTRQISLSGRSQALLERCVSSAPVLESLLVSDSLYPSGFIIQNTLFNGTAPKLTHLTLIGGAIRWNSPLLKGLRVLLIMKPPKGARPTLEAWLDALNEMFQLEVLTLDSASPIKPSGGAHILEPRRTVTLPSLIRFGICASAEDCALALAHLALPVLTSLFVGVQSHNHGGNDIGLLIPHVARNAHGPQDIRPLQTMALSGGDNLVKIYAWADPGTNIKRHELTKMTSLARVVFTFPATNQGLHLDALLTQFPTNALSTLAIDGLVGLSKEFWLRHASHLSTLKQVHLDSNAVGGFRDMLAEDSPENGPRFPILKSLILTDVRLTALRTYRLCDMLTERMVQGVPLEALDLRTCFAAAHAIKLLAEAVRDVYGPAKTLETGDSPCFIWRMPYFNWKGGVEFFNEEEKRIEDDNFEFWIEDTDSGEDDEYGDEDEDEEGDEEDEDEEDEEDYW
jgi:hypothetical protein